MNSQLLQTATARIGDLRLRSGVLLRDVGIAYATLGTLNAERSNVILMTHGFTSSHLFIGRASPTSSEGTWSGLVGPGKAIDTDKFFVVSSNMLGSCFGSTSPASINPQTGEPYGPQFPDLTLSDIVEAQRLMLQQMGIETLVAVVGPSYGGFQGLTWAIDHPRMVRGISMSVSGIDAPAGTTTDALRAFFATDENWNDGNYYAQGDMTQTLVRLRKQTMKEYGIDVLLAAKFPDPQALDAEMDRQARAWAGLVDPNSMLVLATAMASFNARPLLNCIQARVQLVLSRTDQLFPASQAPAVMHEFEKAHVRAEYVALDSDFGHHAAGTDSAKWQEDLRRFVNAL